MSENAMLLEAIRLAHHHSRDGRNGPFGAVITRGDTIVGCGWNRVVETADPTAHAEVVAIRDAARNLGTHDLSGCVLYASCEPCPMCLSATYWARIREVHYAASKEDAAAVGFDDSRILVELGKDWDQRQVGGHRSLAREGAAVLESWALNPRKAPY